MTKQRTIQGIYQPQKRYSLFSGANKSVKSTMNIIIHYHYINSFWNTDHFQWYDVMRKAGHFKQRVDLSHGLLPLLCRLAEQTALWDRIHNHIYRESTINWYTISAPYSRTTNHSHQITINVNNSRLESQLLVSILTQSLREYHS